MQAHPTLSGRLAQLSAAASMALAVLGTFIFSLGSFAYGAQGAVLGACLLFTVPACLLFLVGRSRVRLGDLFGAAILSIIGGLAMIAAGIAAAISSAYANPCFEIARCTRGPTFAYLALLAAMVVFLLTAAIGVFISPAVLGLAARRRVPS